MSDVLSFFSRKRILERLDLVERAIGSLKSSCDSNPEWIRSNTFNRSMPVRVDYFLRSGCPDDPAFIPSSGWASDDRTISLIKEVEKLKHKSDELEERCIRYQATIEGFKLAQGIK